VAREEIRTATHYGPIPYLYSLLPGFTLCPSVIPYWISFCTACMADMDVGAVSKLQSLPLGMQQGEPWYADGNIILRCDDIVFRVYGGLLSQHSNVFLDLLSLPQPEEDSETMDGCPLVPLYHDSPIDLGHFLVAIHAGRGQ
jgi:hypothetical protein